MTPTAQFIGAATFSGEGRADVLFPVNDLHRTVTSSFRKASVQIE